jgi:hypothetical protein
VTVEAEIQQPKKAGRPSEFSIEVMTEICERMAEGKSLREICDSDPDLPVRRTILRWVKNDDGAKKLYDAAQEQRMHWYADELIKIAYDTSNDTITGKDGQPLCNHEWIARSRLKADNLKFLMAKLAPRTYGEKPEAAAAPPDGGLTIGWEPTSVIERIIVSPIRDADGILIDTDGALRDRIRELEQQLGQRPSEPQRLITHDPGPLPRRLTDEVMQRFARAIGKHMPDAEQRSPDAVLDEAISLFEDALEAKYSAATVEF